LRIKKEATEKSAAMTPVSHWKRVFAFRLEPTAYTPIGDGMKAEVGVKQIKSKLEGIS